MNTAQRVSGGFHRLALRIPRPHHQHVAKTWSCLVLALVRVEGGPHTSKYTKPIQAILSGFWTLSRFSVLSPGATIALLRIRLASQTQPLSWLTLTIIVP